MIIVNCSLIPPCHLFRDYTLNIMNVLGYTPAEKIKIYNIIAAILNGLLHHLKFDFIDLNQFLKGFKTQKNCLLS